MTRSTRSGLTAFSALMVIVGAGCDSESMVTDTPDYKSGELAAVITSPTDPFSPEDNGKAYVCVSSPVVGNYTFGISGAPEPGSGNPGPTITSNPAIVGDGACLVVATPGAGAGFFHADLVTATQISVPMGASLTGIQVEDATYSYAGTTTTLLGVTSTAQTDPATGLLGNERATRITFSYEAETMGGEGCTPGYWKQSQHFSDWTGYTPNQAFSSVFEDAFPGMTLVQVAAQGGGGLKALGRHTVAALLNAASGGVDFGMTTTEVINAFNAVYPGGDYETLKDVLAGLNEAGCPL